MRHKIKKFLFGLGLIIGAALLPFAVQAVVCNVTQGCTGLSSVANNALLLGNTTNQSLKVVTIGTEGQILKVVGGVPAWGTDAGGSGNAAWTIGSGLIYNATSTDLV